MNITKKILWILVFLLCVSSAYGWDWDNVHKYDETTKTITIINALYLGNEIAKITLLTETTVKVYPRKDVKVAEFSINNTDETYPNAFRNMRFYDTNNKLKEIEEKDFTYKYRVNDGFYFDDVYGAVCKEVENNITKELEEQCNREIVGKKEVPKYNWFELEDKTITNLPKGEIVIGVFTDVKVGDRVEWIPTLFGVEIVEWAGYVGVAEEVWYKFEDDLLDSSGNGVTRNDEGSPTFSSVEKMRGDYSIYYGATTDYSNYSMSLTGGNHNFSVAWWWYKEDAWTVQKRFWNTGQVASNQLYKLSTLTLSGDNLVALNIDDNHEGGLDLGNFELLPDTWYHMVVTYTGDTKTSEVFVDGVSKDTVVHSDNMDIATGGTSYFNKGVGDSNPDNIFYDDFRLYDVVLEQSDITELYEGNTAPIVNNQFPINSTIQYFDSANFTYNVTDSGDTIVNCSLFINNARIETDTSITQTVNQSINRTSLSVGQHLWKVGCYDDEHLQGNSSEYNLTIKLDSPVIKNIFPANSTLSYSPNVNFTYNVTTLTHSITSCDLFINDVLNATDNSITEDTNQTFNVTTLPYGDSIWLIQCESSEGYKANSSAWNFSRTIAYPIVNLQFPANNTLSYSPNVNFTFNTTIDYGTVDECYLWFHTVYLNATDSSITEIVNQTFNVTTLPYLDNIWKVECKSNLGIKYNSTNYNYSRQISYPSITHISPANNTNEYYPNENFTYQVTVPYGSITECYSFFNSHVINATDSSIEEGVNQTFNTTLPYDDTLWKIGCISDLKIRANLSEYNRSRKRAYPIVDLQAPINNTNSSSAYVNFTYNTSIPYGSISLCDLFINNVLNDTDNSIIQIINQTFNKTLSDNYYSWLIQCESNLGFKTNSSIYNLTIDTTPPEVNESVGLVDIINTTFSITSYWYFNVSDRIMDVETCWYYTSDTSTNTTITCNANTTINWATEGLKSVYYCANDTLGNEYCRTNSLEVFYYNWTQTASKTSLGEGGSVTFNLIINMTDLESRFEDTYAYLNYNNTQYNPSSVHNAENYTFSYTLAIPLGTGLPSGQSINWNWSYAILNSTDILINTTTSDQTQTIYSMGVGSCSFYNDTILNYTLRSEENKTVLNGTIETDFIIRSSTDNTIRFNYSILNEGVSSIEVCVSNETLSHEDYRLYVTTRYEANGHVIEYHYIQNYNLSSASPIQYIDLYDLDSADSTSFLINYKDEYYLSIEGAIVDIQRFYIGDGIYRSVEMGKTNDAGQTRAHLVTEDVKYRFYVRVNGILVYVSPEYLALCQTAPCHIDLYEVTDTSSEYEKAGNIDYTFDLNEDTRSITFTFITQDGTSSDIDMNVIRMDAYLNHTACEETQTSSGGSLTCTVPTAYTNTTYIIEIYEDEDFITQRFFNLNPPAVDYFGYTGIFLAFIIILTLVFMAITSGIAMVVFTIFGLIIVGTINIIDVGNILGIGSAVIWLTVAGVIIIYKLSQRRYH